MKRQLTALSVGGAVLLAGWTPASAGEPRIYHTITSSHGFAVLDQTEGCVRTEVFVSSSVAMYAGQPGPVNKQGLSAVDVRVSDVCASPQGVAPAAGGGGGTILFEADGQNSAPLITDNRLEAAQVRTTIDGTDGTGQAVSIEVAVQWSGTGPLEHTTTQTHGNLGVGNVTSSANDLRRPVTAAVSVALPGRSVAGVADEATLEQTKSRCVEIPRPGVEEFYPCFGFPG